MPAWSLSCCRCPETGVPPQCRNRLYGEFQPLVRRLIRRYGGTNAEMRQDLAGEVYCRFSALVDAYSPERGVPLRPYLVRQLTASVYTFARREWRVVKRQLPLDDLVGAQELASAENPSDAWADEIDSRRLQAIIPEAIRGVPPRQRDAVKWRYFEQHSYEEIATRLGVRPATARSLVRHGINGLRRYIERHETARVPVTA